MEETRIAKLHPFADLPIDIARLLLETAAEMDRATALTLALVSKTVRQWMEPMIYRSIALPNANKVMAFARVVQSRNDPTFFALNVKTLCIGDIESGGGKTFETFPHNELHAISLIFSTCTGVESLGYWVIRDVDTPNAQQDILSPVHQFAFEDLGAFHHLTHLSILDLKARSSLDFLPPRLTHLHVDCFDDDENITEVHWASVFARCNHLTHILLSGRGLNWSIINRSGPRNLLLPLISLLPTTLLLFAVSVVPDEQLFLASELPGEKIKLEGLATDERVVIICPQSRFFGQIDGLHCFEKDHNFESDWVYGHEDDVWEFAESIVASRRSVRE
ncbi:hypothetical protein BDZ89DRAFT_146001 [Hymenopellis radicata]|nr:hypothetical protein BDZ89DRAFT_146001 [Hymenopellis radicata]